MSDTRARIIAAATEILIDGTESRPSVRAVAARAGVGASTLRHHFRSQHELIDTVLESIYQRAMPDRRIDDTSVPADLRLAECLSSLLTPIESPEWARTMWRQLFRIYVDSDQQPGFVALVHQTRTRVESWLEILEREGALPTGERQLRARYLLVVLDGLAVARSLPDTALPPQDEETLLRAAARTVLHMPWPEGGRTGDPGIATAGPHGDA